MYAVVLDRGRQYRAEPGTRLTLDRSGVKEGDTLELPVLLFAADDGQVEVGAPLTARKAVLKVLRHQRGEKGVWGFYRRRKNSMKRRGFRHDQTVVEVVSIG